MDLEMAPGRGHSKRRVIGTILLLAALAVLNGVDRGLMGVMAEPIKHDLQLTDSELGLAAGLVFAVFYTMAGIPLAYLGERFGRNWVLGGAVFLWSLATAACGVITSLGQLSMARAAVGAGESAGTPITHSLIGQYVPVRYRSRALAVIGAGVAIGTTLAFVIGGLGAANLGWRKTFLCIGAVGLVMGLLVLLLLRDPRASKRGIRAEIPSMWSSINSLTRNRDFVALTIVSILCVMGSVNLLTWSTAYLMRQFASSIGQAGSLLGLSKGMGGVVGMLIGGWLSIKASDGLRGVRIPALAVIGGGVAYSAAIFSPNMMLSITLFAIGATLTNIWYSATYTALQSVVPEVERGQAVGLLNFGNSVIGAGLGPLLVGVASDLLAKNGHKGLQLPLIMLGGVAIIAGGLLLFSLSYSQQPRRPLRF